VERGPGEIGDLRDFGGVGGDGGFGGLKVIQTPGHTPGSVCLYFEKEEVLFTGDTLFADGVGRTDFSYGSEKDLLASLEKLSKLPPKIKIYPGHGESGIKLGDLTRGRKNVEWRTEDEE
jgi:glyoxylase-like metal-dependent hydrolase (beta-lactamase superfamily II)